MNKNSIIKIAKEYLIFNKITPEANVLIKQYCLEHNKTEDKTNDFILLLNMNTFLLASILSEVLNYYLSKYQITTLHLNNKIINIY